MASNDVIVRLIADVSSLQSGMDKATKEMEALKGKTEKATSSMTTAFKKVGGIIAGALAVDKMIGFGKECVSLGANLEEMENKFSVVFATTGASMDKWSGDFAKAIGRNKTEIKTGVSNLGDLLIGFGLTEDASGDLSKKVIELSYDLASFNNVQDTDAIDRMTKGILGEHEGLKALGIVINEATIQEKLHQEGIQKKWQEMNEAEKAQIRYKIMLDQTKNAQGDALRSADSYTNKMKNLNATMDTVKETIGGALLPFITKLVDKSQAGADKFQYMADVFREASLETGWLIGGLATVLDELGLEFFGDIVYGVGISFNKLNEFIKASVEWVKNAVQWFKEHETITLILASSLGVLTAGIIAFNIWLKAGAIALMFTTTTTGVWTSVCAVATGVTTAFGVAMAFLTSPIGIITVAIMGLVTVGILLWKNWDTVKAFLLKCWEGIKAGGLIIWEGIKFIITSVMDGIKWYIETVWKVITTIIKINLFVIATIIKTVWTVISTIISTILTVIYNIIASVWNAIYFVIKPALDIIYTVIVAIWQGIQMVIAIILSIILGIVKIAWEGIKLVITTIMNLISTVIQTVWTVISTIISTIMGIISTVISVAWEGIKLYIQTVMNLISTIVSTIWNTIKTYIQTVMNIISTVISTVWNAISGTISTIMGNIKTSVSSIWENIKSVISGIVTGIGSVIETGFNYATNKVIAIFNGLKSAVMGIWNGIGHGIQGVVNGIISVINGMVRAMNKISFDVPDWIPVMGGKTFGFNVPEVPKVSWFATGGIIKGTEGGSIVGVGEAGDEAIVPLSNKGRMKPFAEAVANMMPDAKESAVVEGGVSINVANLVVREEADVKKIGEELFKLQERNRRRRGVVYA